MASDSPKTHVREAATNGKSPCRNGPKLWKTLTPTGVGAVDPTPSSCRPSAVVRTASLHAPLATPLFYDGHREEPRRGNGGQRNQPDPDGRYRTRAPRTQSRC